jgi:hypothetical protein
MPTAFMVTGWTGGNRRTSTAAWAMHTALATRRQQRGQWDRRPHRSLGDDGDPGQREQGADDRHGPQALLTLAHRQQQHDQWDQGQQGLAESGMQPDQGIVGQGERGPEVQGTVQQGGPTSGVQVKPAPAGRARYRAQSEKTSLRLRRHFAFH